MEPTKIFLSHPCEDTRRVLAAIIDAIGHEIIGQASSLPTLHEECIRLQPDLIISAFSYPPNNCVETLESISEKYPTPCIIIALQENLADVEKAMEDHVMAFLIDPVTKDDLSPTILVVLRRFAEMESLKQENKDLKASLQARKKMERAKGILMATQNMQEEAAYLHLRQMATSRRMKIEEVSDLIIEMATPKKSGP